MRQLREIKFNSVRIERKNEEKLFERERESAERDNTRLNVLTDIRES